MFPKKYAQRAFSIYSIAIQLKDTVSALTANLISVVGWRWTFKITGIFGAAIAVVSLIVIREPIRNDSKIAKQVKNEDKDLDENG